MTRTESLLLVLADANETITGLRAKLVEAKRGEDIGKAFHDVAVKERDYERIVNNRLTAERDAAQATLRDAVSDSVDVGNRLYKAHTLFKEIKKEADVSQTASGNVMCCQFGRIYERADEGFKATEVLSGQPATKPVEWPICSECGNQIDLHDIVYTGDRECTKCSTGQPTAAEIEDAKDMG